MSEIDLNETIPEEISGDSKIFAREPQDSALPGLEDPSLNNAISRRRRDEDQ